MSRSTKGCILPSELFCGDLDDTFCCRNHVCKSGEATWHFDNTAWGPSNDEDEDSGMDTTIVALAASVLSFTLLGY